jgi:hypothetical protein
MFTSVARAVGPSVNKILYFSHFQNWKFLNLVMWTHWGLNWFFLPNPIFAIWMNLQQWNSFKNQYLSHLSSENCEINSIKSDLPGTFQQHQECPQNSNTFFISNFIYVSLRKWFNNQQLSYHSSKPVPNQVNAPLSLRPFQRYQEHDMKHCGWGDLSMMWYHMTKQKQNKLPCFINRWVTWGNTYLCRRGTAGDTLVQDKMNFSHLNMECNRTNFNL